MIAKDGLGIVVITLVLFVISFFIWRWNQHPFFLGIMVLFGILSLFNLYFFRDPDRVAPQNPLAVVSPADGKIVQITNIEEPEYFQKKVQRISIFLSVFNVHVNRSPITGKVDYFAYHTGRFLAAFKEKASLENEQTAIGMVDDMGHRVFFKQIAGIIARRIVCHVREGQRRVVGERIGMIRYGSRVDVFLPFEAKIMVKIGDKVKAGETILATFPEPGKEDAAHETILEVPKTEISE
ncbi:MAG: phosphatidylserine decarboxylase family protein [Calditrichaeota bacterium]|nr:MAG: phosphatidylserine decarboxylase family protein [Calditrichota bacterium]